MFSFFHINAGNYSIPAHKIADLKVKRLVKIHRALYSKNNVVNYINHEIFRGVCTVINAQN